MYIHNYSLFKEVLCTYKIGIGKPHFQCEISNECSCSPCCLCFFGLLLPGMVKTLQNSKFHTLIFYLSYYFYSGNLQPLWGYRHPRGNYFYTTNVREIGTARPGLAGKYGYVSIGPVGALLCKKVPGSIPGPVTNFLLPLYYIWCH